MLVNKKISEISKKVFSAAFGSLQQPKAGQNTQHKIVDGWFKTWVRTA